MNKRFLLSAATLLALGTTLAVGLGSAAPQARADEESKEIPCTDTPFDFTVSGYTTKCQDYSRGSISLDVSASVRILTLHAVSDAEATFLDVVDDHILGTSRVYYHRRSMESDIGQYYSHADFKDWADEDDIGSYQVKRVSVTFGHDDPLECVAFRRQGATRYSGIGGITVGLACSALGRDHAVAAVKHLAQKS
jgi:hypothetical protein